MRLSTDFVERTSWRDYGNRSASLAFLVWAVFSTTACGDGTPGMPVLPPVPAAPSPLPSPPPGPQGAATSWTVSISKGSATGVDCVLNDEGDTWHWDDFGSRLQVTMHRAESAITLSHSGPMEDLVYEGNLTGRDFEVRLAWLGGWPLRCSDGTDLGNVACDDEITGRLSEDDRSFTATKRNVCRQVSGANVLTRSWTWSGTRN